MDAHVDKPRSALQQVLAWWQEVRERRARINEMADMPPEELVRMADDVGLPVEDLVRIAGEPVYMAELLKRRMAALGIDEGDVRALSPLLLRDLQRTCACCTDKQRCVGDMAADINAPGWESYCPNAGTLRSLG